VDSEAIRKALASEEKWELLSPEEKAEREHQKHKEEEEKKKAKADAEAKKVVEVGLKESRRKSQRAIVLAQLSEINT